MRDTIQKYISLSVTDCKRLGYFRANEIIQGNIIWSRNGEKTADISFATNLKGVPFAVLSYSYNNTPIEDKIYLRFKHSNLPTTEGKSDCGGYYYFVCPVTGRTCRKLYLGDHGHFVSRHALNVLYEQQKKSKSERTGLYAHLDLMLALEDLEKQPRRRQYYYNGRITPYGRKVKKLKDKFERYNKLMQQEYGG